MEQEQVYCVESLFHYMSVNDKPLFQVKHGFFVDKKEMLGYIKSEKLRIRLGGNSKSSIKKLKVTKESFEFLTILQHKSISNGVERDFYSFRGVLKNRKHPNTGKDIYIDIQYNLEKGEALKANLL